MPNNELINKHNNNLQKKHELIAKSAEKAINDFDARYGEAEPDKKSSLDAINTLYMADDLIEAVPRYCNTLDESVSCATSQYVTDTDEEQSNSDQFTDNNKKSKLVFNFAGLDDSSSVGDESKIDSDIEESHSASFSKQ